MALPGRVWRSNQPVWITELISDDNFPRRPYAAEAGLKVAFGFPIISGSEVIGVNVTATNSAKRKKLTHLHRIQANVKNLVQVLESVMVIG